ncbi:MAG: histidinol phosphate phosphatase domain-containing protein [Deltaproteobacteria bacterium]|nr:histidinol phosphate phosphatase domain-containing protein [Deltaproteobacteria bacterium]
MIDLHLHTLLSDGVLVPSELVARAKAAGYRAMAITDHVDSSNIEGVLEKTVRFVESIAGGKLTVLPGVELTHIPPKDIDMLTKRARRLGAKIIVCHGETIVEPVAEGTNLRAIEAGVDILAHPGLIGEEETALAKKNSVFLEITTRKGHSLANGHVAAMAKRIGAGLILNTDTHEPSDLATPDYALRVALGAGLTTNDYERMRENAEDLLKKTGL